MALPRQIGPRKLSALAVLCLAAAAPAPTRQPLQDAEYNRAADPVAQNEADGHLRPAETATMQATEQRDDLEQMMRQARERVAARAADLQPMLPIIERLGMFPFETLLAIPTTPSSALQGVLLLHGLAHQIERDAEAAHADQVQIAKRARDLAAERAAQIPEASSIEAARAAQERLEAEAKRHQLALAAPAGARLAEPRGQLTIPVEGFVIHNFGDAIETGAATGITYRTQPGAPVVSPCGGKAVFAGPFRSFGLLLIVDCGGGYHFVLAGFERLDVLVGRQLQAGEHIGVMPAGTQRVSPDYASLYMELRHDGAAINPLPWLKARA